MSVVLSARNVGKSFGDFTALADCSFDLRAGRTLGVVGESGSGKSTLGRIVMRLLAPDAGSVTLAGEDLYAMRPGKLRTARRRIQLVPQDPRHALNPAMTVGDNLRFQFAAQRLQRSTWSARIDELLAQVALTRDYVHAWPYELSGGQAQRIAIARAIAGRPDVLVCDEAVSVLDKSVQAQVLNTFADLQRETGVALFFISHDLAVIDHISDDVLVLNRGTTVESGPTRQVLADPQDAYTRELLASRSVVAAG
jgi:ABC-type glutathione transport system ATPase component